MISSHLNYDAYEKYVYKKTKFNKSGNMRL